MKEKVERLAKGVFEYETPGILLSEEEINITVDAGKIYSGSFTIKNNKNTPMKGILYSSSELFRLEQNSFMDRENEIHYRFYGDHMNPLETVKGEICIVSDCGEILMPFTVNIEVPYLESSMGKIKDLFNFANLAKEDTAEALKLFKSQEFKQILLYHDTKYLLLYQNIIKSRSGSQALEEFLIAIRKKLQINISVDKKVLTFDLDKESIMDKVILTKDNWGYAEIRVSTDVPFLIPEHKIIWTENFIGNSYPLEFVVDPAFMHSGNNYGKIFITTAHETTAIEVTCHCNKLGLPIHNSHRKSNGYRIKLTKNYLNFRTNHLSAHEYVSEANVLLERLLNQDSKNQHLYLLMQIHVLIISGNETKAEQLLKEFGEIVEKVKETEVLLYCGYLYLLALLRKDETSIQNALQKIRGFYDGSYNDWKLFWFLLYTDKKYDINKVIKLAEIKELYKNGCRSPILYFEAAYIFNEEPSLLHELQDFELQVLNWDIKNDFISEEAAMQYTYLAGKRKYFSRSVHYALIRLYDKYPNKEILTTICSHLIKGHQRSNLYFRWFQAGVNEQLRITELYEYYMYSLTENTDTVLPQQVLLYFIYNSSLNDRKKSYLYAYIVKNKEKLPEIYRSYWKRVEQFVLKQLEAHNINGNLSLLYEEFISQQGLTAETASQLPYVMFKHEIVCHNPNMKGVSVIHKEMNEEVYTPLIDGTAMVDIYTEDAEIFLIDQYENRFTATAEYTLNKLMHWEYYIDTCYEMKVDHPMILLNLSEKVQTYLKYDDRSIAIRKDILSIQGLNEVYYNKTNLDLIHYYYENFEGELLESYLSKINLHGLSKVDRDKVIEFFIIRDLYDKALDALTEFGFEGIAIKRLIKLCSNLLENRNEEEPKNDFILSLAYHIFKAGKYNEGILKYLVKYFFGTTGEMYELWQAAVGFEMETAALEERLLGQMLFAESYITNSLGVFIRYYKRGSNRKLIKAFLSYNAYKYLIMDRIIQPELFHIMKRELVYEDNEVCTLALLKKLSQEDNFEKDEIGFIDYHLHKLIRKGLILPFYKKFQGIIPLPARINDKIFVEYITNPIHKVTIHYRLEGKNSSDEFISEEMKDIYLGIHVKEFILFYNESIQYYITEEDEAGQVSITESVNVKLDNSMKLEEDTRYNHINFMLTAMEVQDDKTLMESLDNYYKKHYVISKVFKLL
ncbi:hypothetical protein Ana3638_01010 [Anaerocolumna sedimenticola]|uniref:DUF5717 domain-containing protein n=1 Tax=Anaerocolumna sedimenticola TaxID=2696063 RepID=A0A6P1THJ1_9FIRM|nr:DUF5717 family protein [Anaerocolumna sedimenticola]QHQ59549.1 hypothetical protein Ana3638_01010 [Anaerocolumna sedimenticola]